MVQIHTTEAQPVRVDILDFIKRRFSNDCHWIDGNCYYFSLILKSRFPEGTIMYDVIENHFTLEINNIYYDWTGVVTPTLAIPWDEIEAYDSLEYQRIVRDCLK